MSDQGPHVVDGVIRPHPTHAWLEPEKEQTRCKVCGAYRHLSSGFYPCPTATPPEEKKPLSVLFHENHATSEGKYLVKRRDGSVVESPTFVLVGRDPMAPLTLRFYAIYGWLCGHFSWSLVRSMWRFAREMVICRRQTGSGDPGMGRHRRDDPAILAEMRKGRSA